MIKKSLLLLTLLSLIFTSCKDDENISYVLKDTPIKIITNETLSRAGYDENTLPDVFYLQITNSKNSAYSYYAKMKRSDSDGDWESYVADDTDTPLTMRWAGDGENVQVTAATFDFANQTTVDLSVSAKQNNDESFKASDKLFMETTSVAPSSEGITVILECIMPKIVLELDLGADVTDAKNPLSQISIGGTDLNSTFNLKTNEWSASATPNVANITPYAQSYTPASTANQTNAVAIYECIVAPQTVAAGSFNIGFQLNGKFYRCTSQIESTFEQNVLYRLKLTMDMFSEDKPLVEPNVIYTKAGGQLSNSLIDQALVNGKVLKIVGPINAADANVLKENRDVRALDISQVTAADDYDINSLRLTDNVDLKEVKWPQSATTISDYCFSGCSSLKTVDIPASVTEVGRFSFRGCPLTSITLPSGVNTVGEYAFYNCEKLTEITLPSGVKRIDTMTFANCDQLKTITCQGPIEYIGYYAFEGCPLQDFYLTACTEFPETNSTCFTMHSSDGGMKVHINSSIKTDKLVAPWDSSAGVTITFVREN